MKKVIGILGIATFVLAMSLNTYFTNEETEKENIDLMSLVSIATADAENNDGGCSGGSNVCCTSPGQKHW